MDWAMLGQNRRVSDAANREIGKSFMWETESRCTVRLYKLYTSVHNTH